MDIAPGTPALPVIELDVVNVAHGGVFVARHEGRVVFVSDAIPGEKVLARVTDQSKKSFWRAETVKVLEASPHRQAHIWPEAEVTVAPQVRAGGAEFGHIEISHQRELKATVLRESMQRFAKVDVDVPVEAIEGEADGTRYRTRVSLHVDDAGRIGPFAARTHTVVTTADLPLATPAIARAAEDLYADGSTERIDLVQAADGQVRVISTHAGDQRTKHEVIVEEVGGREFQLDADGFWQVHHSAAETLDRAVREILADVEIDAEAQHLDLYGGVGLFAATIASLGGGRVTSVEFNERATEHAGENLAEWVGARAETARVDRFLRTLVQNITDRDRERYARGVIVLDPPRAGAGKGVVADIVRLDPRAVVYVACDPVALARDVATFAERGYTMQRLRAFDLFPNSHHFESIALFTK